MVIIGVELKIPPNAALNVIHFLLDLIGFQTAVLAALGLRVIYSTIWIVENPSNTQLQALDRGNVVQVKSLAIKETASYTKTERNIFIFKNSQTVITAHVSNDFKKW